MAGWDIDFTVAIAWVHEYTHELKINKQASSSQATRSTIILTSSQPSKQKAEKKNLPSERDGDRKFLLRIIS